jgi:transposase
VSMRERSSKEFKESVVAKILNRGDRTIQSVCDEVGVLQGTASKWLRACVNIGANTQQRGRMKWDAEAKLKAVIETTGLNDIDLGNYIRREGLYSNQVAEWRKEIIALLAIKPNYKKDERDDKIRFLERDILRKDRALAEASALLILQKKVDLIWGNKHEDGK